MTQVLVLLLLEVSVLGSELYRRRALIEDALMMGGSSAFEKLRQAFHGASDEQRQALARIVSPETLFEYEGPTPRACFLLLASATPEFAASELVRQGPFRGDVSRLLAGAVGRDTAWVCAFVEALPSDYAGWELQRTTLLLAGVQCSSVRYLRAFISRANWATYYVDRPVEGLVEFFRDDSTLLNHELVAALSGAGIVDEIIRVPGQLDVWVKALVKLAAEDSELRQRLLDATLRGLFRGVSPADAMLHIGLHEALDPTDAEVAARIKQYCLLLNQPQVLTVELGQAMLRRNLGACSSETMLAATHHVFDRGEVPVVKRQLGILREWALLMPAKTQKVRSLMLRAEKLFGLEVQEYVARVQGPCTNDGGGEAVRVPAPKSALGVTLFEHTEPLPGIEERQFATFVSHIFGQLATGPELQSVLDYLGTKPDYVMPDFLLAKAKSFQLYGDFGAPRVQLARLLRAYDPAMDEFEAKQAYGRLHYDDYEWDYIDTNAPVGVLGALFQQVWNARSRGETYRALRPISHRRRNWELIEFRPTQLGFDRLDNISTGLVWLGRFDISVDVSASVEQRILDTVCMFRDYQDRGRSALLSHDSDLVMHWAAWLLQHNLDSLAALAHPAALVATQAVSVHGLFPVLEALLGEHRPLRAPEYSLLALTACALDQRYRSATARVIGATSLAGVFDSGEFVNQVATLWSLGLIRPARLSATLFDAAQLNAITGFRVLEALEGILNRCEDIGESETLVRLAAMLSLDYGTPISLPEVLTQAREPLRAVAVLQAVAPGETKSAQLAANQAQ